MIHAYYGMRAVMQRSVQSESRIKSTLLSALLDEYITEDNQVRCIDVIIDNLDQGELVLKQSNRR